MSHQLRVRAVARSAHDRAAAHRHPGGCCHTGFGTLASCLRPQNRSKVASVFIGDEVDGQLDSNLRDPSPAQVSTFCDMLCPTHLPWRLPTVALLLVMHVLPELYEREVVRHTQSACSCSRMSH